MSGFGDQAAALKMRDTIERIALGIVNRHRPTSFIAQVVAIDFDRQRVEVVEAGILNNDNTIEAKFTTSLMPSEIGQAVEISGSPGQYRVTKVIAGAYSQSDVSLVQPLFLDVVTGAPKLFHEKVSESPLNTLAAPEDDVDLGSQKIVNSAPATAPTDVPNLDQVGDMISDIPVVNYLKGTKLVSFSNLNASDQIVHVNYGGTFISTPVVMTNITSGNSSVAGRWASKAVNVDTVGFDLILWYTPDTTTTSSWSNIGVQWLAMG